MKGEKLFGVFMATNIARWQQRCRGKPHQEQEQSQIIG
jgi:hypothetical protein